MGTYCASHLADLFLYSYVADFVLKIPKKNEDNLDRFYHFTFRYINDVLFTNLCFNNIARST